SVFAAVAGLRTIGVAAADVIGLVDRDFYSDEALATLTTGVTVLPVHEIEGILCNRNAVAAITAHFGKDVDEIWNAFVKRVRETFSGQTLNYVIASRVRSRINDLLQGAFAGADINENIDETSGSHAARITGLDLPGKTLEMFGAEAR